MTVQRESASDTVAQLAPMASLLIVGLLAIAVVFADMGPGSGPMSPLRQPGTRFAGWTAAVIAADWRTSDGQPIQAFDNSLRDLSEGFLKAGFQRQSMIGFTLRPDVAQPVTAQQGANAVSQLAAQGTGGCLLYFTSHGSQQGLVFGPNDTIAPQQMAGLVNSWCGQRPTVVIISACFSGVFVPALAAPNRMVVTAARPDRSSFGCSVDAQHPYFDGCILESLPGSHDFLTLAAGAQACVSRRETAEGLTPPSEPQIWVSPQMQQYLQTLTFSNGT